MQGGVHANFAVIGFLTLLFTSSQALPILDRPAALVVPRTAISFSYTLGNRNHESSRDDHEQNTAGRSQSAGRGRGNEQNVGRSQSTHGGVPDANREDDAGPIIPLYNLANRRGELPSNPSANGLEFHAIEPIVQPSLKPSLRDTSSPNTPTLTLSSPNSASASDSTPADGHHSLAAGPHHPDTNPNTRPRSHTDTDLGPGAKANRSPSLRAAQAAAGQQLQASSRRGVARSRRLGGLLIPQPFRKPAQAPAAGADHQAGRLSHVHYLYGAHQRAGHADKPDEHHGNTWKPESQTVLRGQSVQHRLQPLSFLGRFSPQHAFAGPERPLIPSHHTTSPHEAEKKMRILAALRQLVAESHARLLPLFMGLGRRPYSPYMTSSNRPLPYRRPAGPRPHSNHGPAPHQAYSNAGTIHMASPSLTHSHAIPITFTLSPAVCSPLAMECKCLTADLASRLLSSYPAGVPTSTNSITETVSMIMHGIEYRATLDLQLSSAINGADFKDLLSLLVSVKTELVKATHGQGFGTVNMKNHWHGVGVQAAWTYYTFEHGVARTCA